MNRRPWLALAPFSGIAGLFLVWELYVRAFDVRALTLPPPSRIVVHVFENLGFYADNAATTVTEGAVGFVLAFVMAMIVATAMAHSTFVERASWPVLVLIQSTPIVVLVPVFIRWLGFGMAPKIAIAALFAFVPFVSNAVTGLRSVDADRLDLLHSVNASDREIFWRLRLPSALPALFAAGRICIALSLIGAVIGEYYGSSTSGLGTVSARAASRSFVDQQWGSIFVASFVGIAATSILLVCERRVLRWHASTQQG
ncbi:MAG: ABC transporter permease [Acidimicrobiales bacterium]